MNEARISRLRTLADSAKHAGDNAMDPGRAKQCKREAEAWSLIADALQALEPEGEA